MKIENSGKPLSSVVSRPTDPQKTTRAKAGVESSVATAEEGVSASATPFDAEKVESIKQAIAEGRFTVNSNAVADKLLDSVKELLAK